MAKTLPKTRKTATLTTFPPPETAVAVEDPPVADPTAAEPEPSTPFDPPRKSGRPRKDAEPVETNFFKRVAAIPAADWGTRVYLYLYQLEPVCDLKQSGGKSYLMRYQEPVRDEHQIMLEQGSGKYRLMLALNKITPNQSNELAQYNFEIYNPQYPPRIPKEVWINDPRNRRWEALLPKEQPQTAGTSIVEAMKVVGDIRRDLRSELGEPEPPPRTSEMLETMKAAKELFATNAPPSTAAKDPLEIAVALATTMMQMKADNPVIDMYRDELKAMREELREANAEMRKQKEAAPPSKSLADQLLELAALGEKLEPVKKLFGFGNGASGEVVGRAAKTTALDFARDFFESPAGTAVAQGLASLMVNLASPRPVPNGMPAVQQQRTPIVLNPQQPNGTAPPSEDPEARIQRIGQIITQPMLYEYFFRDAGGDAFAQWMFDGMPEDYLYMRQLGAETIVARYRQFPPAWALIAPKEPAFIQFVQEFCAWDPNEDEAPVPGTGEDDGVVDLEAN